MLLLVTQNFLKNFLIISLCLEGNLLAVEMKDLFTRYTNDVIATSAFGIGCDSLKNPTNEFYEMGRDITNFRGLRALIFFGYLMSPKLMKVRMSVLCPQHSMMTVQ
jgi:cytochrome P450 family 9